MRRVNKTYASKPIELDSIETRTKLVLIVASENASLDTENLYHANFKKPDGVTISRTRTKLADIYKNKCGYCERYSHIPTIDHHRPKGRVTGPQNNAEGYYWLIYEWTNLVPACKDCNSSSYKFDKFPIANGRVNRPPKIGGNINYTLLNYDSNHHIPEKPLILHPEYCVIPEIHFDFTKDGKIHGISKEGKASVSTYGLDRKDLNIERRDIYDDYFRRLKRSVDKRFRIANPISQNELIDDLKFLFTEITKAANSNNLNHTLFRKSFLKKLSYYFIEPITVANQTQLKDAISEALLLI